MDCEGCKGSSVLHICMLLVQALLARYDECGLKLSRGRISDTFLSINFWLPA